MLTTVKDAVSKRFGGLRHQNGLLHLIKTYIEYVQRTESPDFRVTQMVLKSRTNRPVVAYKTRELNDLNSTTSRKRVHLDTSDCNLHLTERTDTDYDRTPSSPSMAFCNTVTMTASAKMSINFTIRIAFDD